MPHDRLAHPPYLTVAPSGTAEPDGWRDRVLLQAHQEDAMTPKNSGSVPQGKGGLYPDGLRRALAALYGQEPLTLEHVAEHRRLVPRQEARDEAERSRQRDPL